MERSSAEVRWPPTARIGNGFRVGIAGPHLAGNAQGLQSSWVKFCLTSLSFCPRSARGAPSTAEDVLAELALDYPLPAVLMEYRGLSKLKSTHRQTAR